jgi:hypothetical protein
MLEPPVTSGIMMKLIRLILDCQEVI